jgi:hypothetical protein
MNSQNFRTKFAWLANANASHRVHVIVNAWEALNHFSFPSLFELPESDLFNSLKICLSKNNYPQSIIRLLSYVVFVYKIRIVD